jgi:hypothetical protein
MNLQPLVNFLLWLFGRKTVPVNQLVTFDLAAQGPDESGFTVVMRNHLYDALSTISFSRLPISKVAVIHRVLETFRRDRAERQEQYKSKIAYLEQAMRYEQHELSRDLIDLYEGAYDSLTDLGAHDADLYLRDVERWTKILDEYLKAYQTTPATPSAEAGETPLPDAPTP